MPDLIPFHYESHEIHVQLDANGEPWWVAADIGDALDYPNIANVVKRLDGDEKGIRSVYTPGGIQSLWCVNEAGLYALILGSRKPEAKAFKRWITHDVLPTLRTTGQYALTTSATQDPLHARTATLIYLQAHRDFLDELGMLDDRDKLMLADCARNLLAAPTTAMLVAPDDGFIVAEYRSRYATEPSRRIRFVDGATREVNYYHGKEAAWIDPKIRHHSNSS